MRNRTSHDDLAIASTFQKNINEEVRAYVQTYKGTDLAHIRVFAPDEHDVIRPTKKGIAVRVEQLPELFAAVEALMIAAGEFAA